MSRPCTETEIDHEDVNSVLFVASDIKKQKYKTVLKYHPTSFKLLFKSRQKCCRID